MTPGFVSGGGGSPRPLIGYHSPLRGSGDGSTPEGNEVSFLRVVIKVVENESIFKNINTFLGRKIHVFLIKISKIENIFKFF